MDDSPFDNPRIELVTGLEQEARNLIQRYIDECQLNLSEVVGVLEILKVENIYRALQNRDSKSSQSGPSH